MPNHNGFYGCHACFDPPGPEKYYRAMKHIAIDIQAIVAEPGCLR
jgi:hypothetical protein